MSLLKDHVAQGKPVRQGRWSWAFMRRDTYDGPGRKWTRNRFLIGKPGNPMMERWRLIQTPLFGIYVHQIYREDLDPVPHDHPWRFWSLVLRGGYEEEYYADTRMIVGDAERRHFYDRWDFHHFPLNKAHRITEVRPGTVTLVLVGRKVRTWGFYDMGRFVDWREALGIRPTEGARSTGKYLA